MEETPQMEGACGLAPEIRLILLLLRAPDPSVPPIVPEGVDWTVFVQAVAAHRLPLALRMDHPVAALLPLPVMEQLRAQRNAGARRALLMTATLANAMRALREAGIRALALKGPAFAALLQGNPTDRLSTDLDIAVAREDMAAAAALFAGLGFSPAHMVDPEATGPVQWPLYRATDQMMVELHSLPLSRETDPVAVMINWDSAVSVMVGGESIRTPNPALAIVYAAQHGCRHRWFRLFWLLDIDRAARSAALDWGHVLDVARRAGCERHVFLALALANRLFATPLPPPLLDSRRKLAGARFLCRLLLPIFTKAYDTEQEAAYRMGLIQSVLFDMVLREGAVARLSSLARHLRPTDDDRRAFGLPPYLSAFYPVLRLGRLLWRVVGGRRRRMRK